MGVCVWIGHLLRNVKLSSLILTPYWSRIYNWSVYWRPIISKLWTNENVYSERCICVQNIIICIYRIYLYLIAWILYNVFCFSNGLVVDPVSPHYIHTKSAYAEWLFLCPNEDTGHFSAGSFTRLSSLFAYIWDLMYKLMMGAVLFLPSILPVNIHNPV